MSDSYKRRCQNCKLWIQLRKMPGGQWVAFEGWDTIHDCKQPVATSAAPKWKNIHDKGDLYDNIELGDFDIPGSSSPALRPTHASRSTSRYSKTPPSSSTVFAKSTVGTHPESSSAGGSGRGPAPTQAGASSSSNWGWCVGGLVLVWLFLRNC